MQPGTSQFKLKEIQHPHLSSTKVLVKLLKVVATSSSPMVAQIRSSCAFVK